MKKTFLIEFDFSFKTKNFLILFQIFLLPDRCDKSKRRSKTLASTTEPRWGQTFVYSGLRRADLINKFMEV